MVSIHGFDFAQSLVLKKLVTFNSSESDQAQKLYFRVAFYDQALDRTTAPVVYSQQTEHTLLCGAPLEEVAISWMDEQLPTLRSARNTLALARKSRLLMTVWAGGHPAFSSEVLVGHVNIKLDEL